MSSRNDDRPHHISPPFRRGAPFLAGVALFLVAGCGGFGFGEDPLLQLSAEEALEQGKALLEEGKYLRAEEYLTHAFEVAPNSRDGREALLLAADALYLRGGAPETFIRCEAKYRDFINRFPTSERADYAQYQVANCLASRMERPDRDQSVTFQAREAYQELMRLYPSSPYAAEARTKLEEVAERLADHEMVIGNFYLRFRNCQGSIQRLEYLLDNFPGYDETDRAHFVLGLAYELCNQRADAEATFIDLRQKFPASPWIDKIERERQKITKLRAKQLKRFEKASKGRFRPQPPEEDAEEDGEEGEEGADAGSADEEGGQL